MSQPPTQVHFLALTNVLEFLSNTSHIQYLKSHTNYRKFNMTPVPTQDELDTRGLLNPMQGTIHVIDLVNQVKDGIYTRDKVSDLVIGILLVAVQQGAISA